MSLAVRKLTVHLGTRAIVSDVSFEIPPGALAFMVGPNGAGKTTAVRAAAGLVPASGRVVIDGQDLTGLAAHARAHHLAYVPQGHVAHWPLAVRDVIAVGRRPGVSSLGPRRRDDDDAIDAALASVDAVHLANRPVTELSGGERARVMLARALATNAPLILADEPIAALDPRHQLAVAGLLKRLAGEGRTILAVVHDLALAARFGDRVLVMCDGRLVADGPPAEVLTDSVIADVFGIEVARFDHAGQRGLAPWAVREPTGAAP
ncbi:MAG: ABC transporter ATP-binding protein [Hyphomicrobiaceae bacterium]